MGQRVQSSLSGPTMEVWGLIWMMGDGSHGGWFLARNSGRKQREMDSSGSDATLDGKLLRACTSLQLWREASTMRKAVSRVSCFRGISQILCMGKDAEQTEPEKGPMLECAWGLLHLWWTQNTLGVSTSDPGLLKKQAQCAAEPWALSQKEKYATILLHEIWTRSVLYT